MNGNDLFALSRNTGQALAFANYEPKHVIGPFFNYLSNNSINFDGLDRIEELIRRMGPPRWPWPDRINPALAGDGARIFDRECGQCHGIRDGEIRSLFSKSWATPVQNVGTDTHQFDELGWKAKTGVLAGAGVPGIAAPLKEEDYVVSMMFTSVVGSIAQHLLSGGFLGDLGSSFGGGSGDAANTNRPMAPRPDVVPPLPPALRDLAKAYRTPNSQAGAPETLTIEKGTLLANTLERGAYEARVLQGIWAAAPYLHNGSVPTLAELLKPAAQRTSQFSVGARYDVDNVGLAATQDGASPPRAVTDCSDLNSGNSKCGHEYGTSLSEQDKKALLEYLKTL
jgi:mono/diheme cytochrome c family protein